MGFQTETSQINAYHKSIYFESTSSTPLERRWNRVTNLDNGRADTDEPNLGSLDQNSPMDHQGTYECKVLSPPHGCKLFHLPKGNKYMELGKLELTVFDTVFM